MAGVFCPRYILLTRDQLAKSPRRSRSASTMMTVDLIPNNTRSAAVVNASFGSTDQRSPKPASAAAGSRARVSVPCSASAAGRVFARTALDWCRFNGFRLELCTANGRDFQNLLDERDADPRHFPPVTSWPLKFGNFVLPDVRIPVISNLTSDPTFRFARIVRLLPISRTASIGPFDVSNCTVPPPG